MKSKRHPWRTYVGERPPKPKLQRVVLVKLGTRRKK
jgi:hypothetical protein